MSALQRTLPLFFILGLISGTACWALHFVLPDKQWVVNYYPAVVLGVFLYLAGAYIARVNPGNRIAVLLVLIIASILGWRLAVEVGRDLGGPLPFLNAGTLGGFIMALGLLLGWRIRSGGLKFVMIVTAAGALGGLVFHFLDRWFIGHMETGEMWILILFAEWQSIFMAGAAVALNYSRTA